MAWCHQATGHYLNQCWQRLITPYGITRPQWVNTLRPRQNGRHFADDMFKCIFLNENVWIPIEISLKFVPKGSINNNAALFRIMAWRRPGDKPLSEPMMVSSLTHICVTRPQWVNSAAIFYKRRSIIMNCLQFLPKWILFSNSFHFPGGEREPRSCVFIGTCITPFTEKEESQILQTYLPLWRGRLSLSSNGMSWAFMRVRDRVLNQLD